MTAMRAAPYVLRATVDVGIGPELVPMAMARAVERMARNLVNLGCDMTTVKVRTIPAPENPNGLRVLVSATPGGGS